MSDSDDSLDTKMHRRIKYWEEYDNTAEFEPQHINVPRYQYPMKGKSRVAPMYMAGIRLSKYDWMKLVLNEFDYYPYQLQLAVITKYRQHDLIAERGMHSYGHEDNLNPNDDHTLYFISNGEDRGPILDFLARKDEIFDMFCMVIGCTDLDMIEKMRRNYKWYKRV